MKIPNYIPKEQHDTYRRKIFIRELMKITKISEQYADAAWYTTCRCDPYMSAKHYKERFRL